MTLPHPANFALHKLIVSQRRLKEDKAAKDMDAAICVLKALIDNNETDIICKVFHEAPSGWQKKIVAGLKLADEPVLLELITKSNK